METGQDISLYGEAYCFFRSLLRLDCRTGGRQSTDDDDDTMRSKIKIPREGIFSVPT